MVRKISLGLVVGAILIFFNSNVLAAAELIDDLSPTSKIPGFYLTGNAGYGKVNERVSPRTKTHNKGFVWNAALGYQFTDNIAVELGYLNFPKESFGTAKGSKNWSAYLAANGILPFNNDFAVFGKLGIAKVQHRLKAEPGYSFSGEGSHSKVAALLGAGVLYNFTPSLAASLQVIGTTKSGKVPAMYAALIGIIFRFA